MAKIRIILALILTVLFAFRVWQTTGCHQFAGFYFNPLAIVINVESQRSLDEDFKNSIPRFFHNKVTSGIFEYTKTYFSTFNPRFLLELLGPIGIVAVFFGVKNVIERKRTFGIFHLILILVASFIATLAISPKTAFFLIAFSWYSFTFQGIANFSTRKTYLVMFILLIPITLWYFLFSWQIPAICHEIFFN